MKNLTPILLSGLLALGAVACEDTSKTSTSAPNSTSESPTAEKQTEAKTTQDDATSEVRRKQLNSDIRAREQRANSTGAKSDDDVASEVRSKLEANLPSSALAVEAKDGAVKVTGTVVDEKQLAKIEPLAKEISEVKSVTVDAKVSAGAKPTSPKAGSNTKTEAHTNDKKQ